MARNCSLDECRQYFEAVCDAGFFHLAHKCQFHEFFARYSAEVGHKDEGLSILKRLKEEVEALPGNAETDAWREPELARIDSLITDIDADRLRATWCASKNRPG